MRTTIKNELLIIDSNKKNLRGNAHLTFSGADIKINYDIKDKLILLSSDKSYIRGGRNNFFNGKINTSPFYYDIHFELDSIIFKIIPIKNCPTNP